MWNSAWKYVLGENYCAKVTDGTHTTPKQVASGRYLVTSKHIKGDEIDFDNAYFISEEDFREINKRSKVDQWDIIISMIGAYCGFCFIEKNLNINYAVKNVGLFKAGTELNAKWLYYYLNSTIGKANLDAAKGGSSQPYIALGALRKLPILTPVDDSLKEKIVGVLDCIDEKVRTNNRINTELGAMAKILYDYWFVQFDFPDANGKPYKSSGGKMIYNSTLKRKMPVAWSPCELSEIISRSATGLNPRDNFKLGYGKNYYVTIKNVSNGKIVLDEKCDRIDDETLGIIDRRSQLQPGDVLFTSIEPVGVTYLIQVKPANWNINESVFTIRPNYDKTSSEHLFLFLSSSEMKAFTKNSSSGSIHKGIRHGVLKTFKLAYGNKALIDKFSTAMKPILKRIDIIDRENHDLTRLRDWLLPMLMNGQIVVK